MDLEKICNCEAQLFSGRTSICTCGCHVTTGSGTHLKARPAPGECRNLAVHPIYNPQRLLTAPDVATLNQAI